MATILQEQTSPDGNGSQPTVIPLTPPLPPPPPRMQMSKSHRSPQSQSEANDQVGLQISPKVQEKPPIPSKPKGLVRALTISSINTFRSSKHSLTSSMEEKDETEEQALPLCMGQLREQPLWKLPGLGITPRRSSIPEAASPDKLEDSKPELKSHPRLPPLPPTPPPVSIQRHCSLTDIPHDLVSSSSPRASPRSKPSHLSSTLSRSTPQSPLISRDYTKEEDSISTASEVLPSQTHEENVPDQQSFSIKELMKNYSESFPLRIKVLQGYCSETNDVTMSTGDQYVVHFVKHIKTVKAKDEDGFVHSLPLGGGLQLGLIYNPNSSYDEALQGIDFPKVSDILSATTTPKVISASQAWAAVDDKVHIQENEILTVRQVHKPVFGKKCLRVFSLLDNIEKLLPEDCCGQFSTKPSLVRLHLLEILEHIDNLFPCQAVMYSSTDVAQPGHHLHDTQSRVITMSECVSENVLVASVACSEGEFKDEEQQMFDIPLDDELAEVEVALLECKRKESESEEDDHVYDDATSFVFLRNQNVEHESLMKSSDSDAEDDPPYDDTVSTVKFSGAMVRKEESPYATANATTSKSALKPSTSDDEHNKDMDSKDGYASLPLIKSEDHKDAEKNSDTKDDGTSTVSWMEEIQCITQSLDNRMKSLEALELPSELQRYLAITYSSSFLPNQ